MSSDEKCSGLWYILTIPPRLFDWAMNNKIKTLLLIGAVLYAKGKIQDALLERDLERQEAEERIAKEREQEATRIRLEKNQFDKMTFRNIPKPQPPKPSEEELKRREQERQQALLEQTAIEKVGDYSFSSAPTLPTKPIPMGIKKEPER